MRIIRFSVASRSSNDTWAHRTRLAVQAGLRERITTVRDTTAARYFFPR